MKAERPIDPVFLDFQLALAGRYSIDRELGRGGMGIVYLAREVQLDRLVAIKLLPPEHALDDERRARFAHEARLAAKLSHPNIIPIFAVDEAEGFVYYVMAYVDGETLAERVRARGPLGGMEAARILREVAWALGHAHGQGVVHRDVKPENILLEAGTGRALVADFGIAAALGDDSATGVAGTPEYMSPEQALGKEIDARSDLYALGATAFFICSGRVPFDGSGPVEILAKHVTEPAPLLSAVGATIPRRLSQVVERCLAKDPDQRPASAVLLAEQLGAALEQRREVPAVLRAFVKRDASIGGPGTIVGVYGVMMLAAGAGALAGPVGAIGAVVVGVGVVPAAYLVWAARRVVRHGFRHEDLPPAFRAEIDSLREEFEAHHGRGRPRLERILGRTAAISGTLAAVGTVLMSLMPGVDIVRPMAFFVSAGFAVALPSYIGFRVLRGNRPHAGIARWERFWRGRIGRAAFALAARLPGRKPAQQAVTHRATELSLGLAAEQLFESLPKESRRALGDVPAVLQRLQQQAHRLKERHATLQSALEDAAERSESPELADVREARDESALRIREVVGALETMRLNLLRLHAGSTTLAGLTTQFGAASDLAKEVERLIEARAEVEAALRGPRP